MKRFVDLDDLYEAYREDPKFEHLRIPGIKLVPGEGAVPAKVMVLGEAPGATENNLARPFVGASGRVLRQLLSIAELTTEICFITNVVKYRPPGNRTPTDEEILASRPYLRAEWKLLGMPKLIIACGGVAISGLGLVGGIGKFAGVPLKLENSDTWVAPMYHPAFPLRNRAMRPIVEKHWHQLAEWLVERGEL